MLGRSVCGIATSIICQWVLRGAGLGFLWGVRNRVLVLWERLGRGRTMLDFVLLVVGGGVLSLYLQIAGMFECGVLTSISSQLAWMGIGWGLICLDNCVKECVGFGECLVNKEGWVLKSVSSIEQSELLRKDGVTVLWGIRRLEYLGDSNNGSLDGE